MDHGPIFVAHGDITALTADALVISLRVERLGELSPAFEQRFGPLGFQDRYMRARQEHAATNAQKRTGRAFWVPLCDADQVTEWELGPEPHSDGRRPPPKPPFGIVPVQVFDLHEDEPPTKNSAAFKEVVWDTNHPAYRAAAGAVRTAAAALEELRPLLGQSPQHRFLIALPALRMGGGGDRHHPLPSACLQVQAVRAVLNDYPLIDVAFVAYTPDIYEVYVEARRRSDTPPKADLASMPEPWPKLATALRGGECVVFVGAGFSRDARVPDYDALIGALAEQLGETVTDRHVDSYLDWAQWHRDARGPAEQHALMRRFYEETEAQPTLAHYLLTGLPVSYFITTNYDSLLEQSLRAQRREPETVITQQEIARTGRRQGTYVVKFHGDPSQRRSIVLTRDDYDTFFDRPRGRAMAALLQGLLLNQTFFFVGYSLRDPNFRQIYNQIAGLLKDSKRPAFATTFEPISDHLCQQWAKKQLFLIPIADRGAGASHYLWQVLDELAAAATGGWRLFLSQDVEREAGVGPIRELRSNLIDDVGETIKKLHSSQRALTREQIGQTARVLSFLAQQGWRPRRVSLSKLWWRLAARLEDEARRQMREGGLGPTSAEALCEEIQGMLRMALVHAEGLVRITSLRAQIAHLASDAAGPCLFQQARVEWIERHNGETVSGRRHGDTDGPEALDFPN